MLKIDNCSAASHFGVCATGIEQAVSRRGGLWIRWPAFHNMEHLKQLQA